MDSISRRLALLLVMLDNKGNWEAGYGIASLSGFPLVAGRYQLIAAGTEGAADAVEASEDKLMWDVPCSL